MSYFFRHVREVVISYEQKCACTAIVQVYGFMLGTQTVKAAESVSFRDYCM